MKTRCSVCGKDRHKNTKRLSCEDRKKKIAAEEAAAAADAAAAGSNPSSSVSARGRRRPRGTRHYRGARRRPNAIGKLGQALRRSGQVIFSYYM